MTDELPLPLEPIGLATAPRDPWGAGGAGWRRMAEPAR